MPDTPRLPDQTDYIPTCVEYVAQGLGPKLPKGALENQFSKEKNDLEKFTYLWQQELLHEMVTLEPEFEGKDQGKATECRQKGNTYFKKKSYLSAMESYNQCILYALDQPKSGDDHELTLAYNNRSAALYHLKKYEMSLRDINMAIDTGYPKDSLYKVYDRRGKCYYALKQKSEAVTSFQKAIQAVSASKLDEKGSEKWNFELNRQIQLCEELPEKSEPLSMDFNRKTYYGNVGHYSKTVVNSYSDNYKLPKVTPRPHDTHHSASNALHFKYDKVRGRHAVAKQDVTIGDPLIVEKPLAAVLFPKFYPDHCYNCLARIVAPIPCSQCVSIVYCCTECRTESWSQFHRFECSFFVLFRPDWCGRIAHLVHRLVLTVGMEKLMDYISDPLNQEDKPAEKAGLSKDGEYRQDVNALLHLETNAVNKSPQTVLQFTAFAACLVKLLKSSGYLKEESTIAADYESQRNMEILGGVVLQLLQAVQCNAKGIKEAMLPSDFESIKPEDIGVGMYTTTALLNHSCYPNTELIFYGSTLAVRATRMIYEGQEITCSYGPNFYMNKKFYRIRCLSNFYGFLCKCEACSNDWPMWKDVESKFPEFACENCHRYIDIGEVKELQNLTCPVCSHMTDMKVGWGRLTVSHEEYAKAIENAVHMKLDLALPRLAGHMMLMQRHLTMPWKDMLVCESAIQNCYKLLGNKKMQFC